MKANEIETQLQIVHYSEQDQHFFFQSRKNQIPPPNYVSFWITNRSKFKTFFKHLAAIRSKAPELKISFSFLEEIHQKYQDKQHTTSLMDVLVQEAIHITKYN